MVRAYCITSKLHLTPTLLFTASGEAFPVLLELFLNSVLQNEYIEEHIKRHGRRLDHFERRSVEIYPAPSSPL